MIYQIDFDSETSFLLRHFSPDRKQKIKESLRRIAGNPTCGKTLQDSLQGLLSYRVGRLRIVYRINAAKKTIHVIAIGPRRTIYQDLEKELTVKRR